MKTFSLQLLDAKHQQTYESVVSFVGEDATGRFGILADHARFMTVLKMGLARFQQTDQAWSYLATTDAVLYFKNNTLVITCRHFVIESDYSHISARLQTELLDEEALLIQQKQGLRRMEEEMLRRLWELSRAGS